MAYRTNTSTIEIGLENARANCEIGFGMEILCRCQCRGRSLGGDQRCSFPLLARRRVRVSRVASQAPPSRKRDRWKSVVEVGDTH